MAKFYSIILPRMDASPEVVCFLLKANIILTEDLTVPLHAEGSDPSRCRECLSGEEHTQAGP